MCWRRKKSIEKKTIFELHNGNCQKPHKIINESTSFLLTVDEEEDEDAVEPVVAIPFSFTKPHIQENM